MPRALLIFIDGFGLGESDPAANPLVRFPTPFLTGLLGAPLTRHLGAITRDDACLVPTDATLGVPGLPQSATGQTALLTGVNAAALIGCHVQAFPGPRLAAVIREHGILGRLAAAGLAVTSANMYTPDYMDLVAQGRRRHSATTLTIMGAGLPFRSVAEMTRGEAVYQDITNAMLPALGVHDVSVVTPTEAGSRLARLAASHHFTMFEYFQTDRFGHKRDWDAAAHIVATLDAFLGAVHAATPADMLVVVTSDHGNFEDLSGGAHNVNPVPTILWGDGCRDAATDIRDLTDVAPVIVARLTEQPTR